jgi:hypothetical protein
VLILKPKLSDLGQIILVRSQEQIGKSCWEMDGVLPTGATKGRLGIKQKGAKTLWKIETGKREAG